MTTVTAFWTRMKTTEMTSYNRSIVGQTYFHLKLLLLIDWLKNKPTFLKIQHGNLTISLTIYSTSPSSGGVLNVLTCQMICDIHQMTCDQKHIPLSNLREAPHKETACSNGILPNSVSTPRPSSKRTLCGRSFSPKISKFFKTPILTLGMDILTTTMVKHDS